MTSSLPPEASGGNKGLQIILIIDPFSTFVPLGRSIDEAIRMVDALKYYEENGEVCPANWHQGEKGMKATQEGVAEYLGNK